MMVTLIEVESTETLILLSSPVKPFIYLMMSWLTPRFTNLAIYFQNPLINAPDMIFTYKYGKRFLLNFLNLLIQLIPKPSLRKVIRFIRITISLKHNNSKQLKIMAITYNFTLIYLFFFF